MTTSPAPSGVQPPATLPSLPEGLSPDALDTVPVLASILTRLQNLSQTSTHAGSPPAATPTTSHSQITSGTGSLTIKDIPAATDDLKHKLQKARAQVKELPDIERSLGEQEEEIRELERRIGEQRKVLEGLRGVGESGSGKVEGVMEG